MGKIFIGLIITVFCLPAYGYTAPLEPTGEVPVPKGNPETTAKIELGKKLFFDRRLSGDGTMSCATCHDPKQSFSDGMEISLNYPTTRNWRNSPTLINVAFQKYLFHDGRAASLEEQALFPMMSAFEMNQNLDFMEEEIRAVPEYVAEFTEIFGDPDITRERVAMAIAAFERTLISHDAPLDRFLRGDKTALSPEAIQGYEIFTGKGKCSECHYGAKLADDRFHALQVRENPEHLKDPRIAATRRFVAKISHFDDFRTLAEDPGRYLITKDQKDWKAFRTPSLREIVGTSPYMHNGIYATLTEVIEFFNAGGGENNTVLKPLQLTAAEKKQLQVFLEEGLTGAKDTFTYPKIP
ncbi:MAG: cytochrome c peroxidase [Pseudomonadota bacterium]